MKIEIEEAELLALQAIAEEHAEYTKLFAQFDGGAMGLALHLSANEQLREENKALRANKEKPANIGERTISVPV
jgi:hypothetical protein